MGRCHRLPLHRPTRAADVDRTLHARRTLGSLAACRADALATFAGRSLEPVARFARPESQHGFRPWRERGIHLDRRVADDAAWPAGTVARADRMGTRPRRI